LPGFSRPTFLAAACVQDEKGSQKTAARDKKLPKAETLHYAACLPASFLFFAVNFLLGKRSKSS